MVSHTDYSGFVALFTTNDFAMCYFETCTSTSLSTVGTGYSGSTSSLTATFSQSGGLPTKTQYRLNFCASFITEAAATSGSSRTRLPSSPTLNYTSLSGTGGKSEYVYSSKFGNTSDRDNRNPSYNSKCGVYGTTIALPLS